MNTYLRTLWIGLISYILLVSLVSAQSGYPVKSIRLIIPFAPGGLTDTSGRYIADQLSIKLGQQVFAENRSGATGNIGTSLVVNSEPDGYTLLLGFDGTLVINPHVSEKTPFDSIRDLTAIGKIGDAVLVLVANNNFPGKTFNEMIAIAKKDPQGLTYGTAGIGSSPHIAGELLKQKTGANLVHIPYKGGGQAMTDLLGGNIPLGYTAVAGAIQHIKLGRLTPLAVSSFQRISSLPDVPTIIESGIKDFELSSWVGLLAPSKTPRPIVLRVNQALNEILVSAEGKDRLNAMGIIATAGTPEKFSEQIKYDLNRFGAIVKNANIKAE
jgi:tripartite-type tricarboxylate transporter receptor subunit TctC